MNRIPVGERSAILAGTKVHETYPGSFVVALPHLDDQWHPEKCAACGHVIGGALPARRMSNNATVHLGMDRDGYTYDCRKSF